MGGLQIRLFQGGGGSFINTFSSKLNTVNLHFKTKP